MPSFVLAHLSDPHLAPLPRPRFAELLGKRIGGFYNWHRNRRRIHLAAIVDRLVADLKAHAPDHVVVTGDLTNLSLASEYAPARAWLARLGAPHDVTLVPGNHDTYVRSAARHPQLHWAEYMAGDEARADGETFPFLRRRGPLALIGLSTAVPAPLLRATGQLGAEQLARCAPMLAALRKEAVFRVVLLHHPPGMAPRRHHERLIDEAAFLDLIREQGADLVLHGHEHEHALRWLDAPARPVPMVGVPSASSAAGGDQKAAAYNLYLIDTVPGGWHCEMISRGFAGGDIRERQRTVLLEN
jgi:3',5'-cyclic AMP phosphodiesterase CpdA